MLESETKTENPVDIKLKIKLKTSSRRQLERGKKMNNMKHSLKVIRKPLPGYNTWVIRVLKREYKNKIK